MGSELLFSLVHLDNDTGPDAEKIDAPLAPGLYIVATPIGNLGDLSARAADILRRADLILAEDRRVAAKLLHHAASSTSVLNYSDHNAASVRDGILRRLEHGQAIALTSDAGTPLISDPGYKLVDETRSRGIRVHAVPGPSAVTAALSVSGLPTDRFMFVGFPPPKSAARRRFIEDVSGIKATLVFYESPRRVAAFVNDLLAVLGDRPAAVARELTKLYEEVRRAPLSEIAAHYRESGDPRGEIVVMVGWADLPADQQDTGGVVDERLRDLMKDMPLRDAVDLVAEETGMKRRAVYRRALDLKDDAGSS